MTEPNGADGHAYGRAETIQQRKQNDADLCCIE
jgi:hypothetical protein